MDQFQQRFSAGFFSPAETNGNPNTPADGNPDGTDGFWQTNESTEAASAPTTPQPESTSPTIANPPPFDPNEGTGLEDLAAAALEEPFAMAPDFSLPGPEEKAVERSSPSISPDRNPSANILSQPNAELAQLRAENEQLYEHIAQMEGLLQECQATLELQMMRSQTQESLITRQTQELEETHKALQDTQTEADRILTELEKSGQILQRQAQELADAQQLAANLQDTLEQTQREVARYQVVVETLTQELDNSQTRIAHLEHTCGQLQQRSLDQDAAIAQTDAHCQELQSRLNRQQRQTLQFRAALDRCLGLNLATDATNTAELEALLQLPPGNLSPGTIQPWSLPAQPTDPSFSAVTLSEATPSEAIAPPTPPPSTPPTTPPANPSPVSSEEPTPIEAQPLEADSLPPKTSSAADPEIFPSTLIPAPSPTPITLPPLGEIPDAEIEEADPPAPPVEVSPSDIVALLDWTLEDPPAPESPEPADHASDDSDNSADTKKKKESEISPAQPIPSVQPATNAIAPVQPPETLKQPLANLLSLGTELLNLQGLESAASSNSSPPSTPGNHGEPEPESVETEMSIEEEISVEETVEETSGVIASQSPVPPSSLESEAPSETADDSSQSPQRTSLASVELPNFS